MVCDYGELNVAEFGHPGLTIRAKFCFDLKDFSAATAPALEHELVIWDVTAATQPVRLRLRRAEDCGLRAGRPDDPHEVLLRL